MIFGISLSPGVLSETPRDAAGKKLLAEYGGAAALLKGLSGLGITHIELRAVRPEDDGDRVLACAEKIWNAGMRVTVHGAVPPEPGAFEDTYPSLLPLLREAKAHQDTVTITLHAYSSDKVQDEAGLSAKTRQLLALWSGDADRLGFRFALEVNREKDGKCDPANCCAGVTGILRELDGNMCGGCFDFGHYYYNMSRRSGTPGLLPESEFLSRCIHTHIHALSLAGSTHFPFAEDTALPLEQYVEALLRAGYKGVFNLELDYSRFPDACFRDAIRNSVLALKAAWHKAAPVMDITRKRLEDAAAALAPEKLRRMRAEIFDPSPKHEDSLWAFAVSGYIFRTGGALFAVDPVVRAPEILRSAKEEIRALFRDIPYIFITHFHDDHFDPCLAQLLSDLPCKWILPPDHAIDTMVETAKLRGEKIIYVSPGDSLTLPGITAEVFPGRHRHRNGVGIDEVMYRFTVGGRTIFLTGDVRDYGTEKFPRIESPDLLISHVWLWKGMAQRTKQEAVEEYCDFVAHFQPKRVLLGHLMEFSRRSTDLWNWEHAGRVMDGLALRIPETEVTPIRLFGRYDL